MVYLIPKSEMPVLQYTPVKYKDEIAMFAVSPNGPVILFTATDELIFAPWDEVITFAATSPRKQPPAPEQPEQKKDDTKPRTIKSPTREN